MLHDRSIEKLHLVRGAHEGMCGGVKEWSKEKNIYAPPHKNNTKTTNIYRDKGES